MSLSWSQRRKLKYTLVLAILPVFLLSWVIYKYLTRPPSCFDGRQNGSETGIDCGGACQRVCNAEVSDLIVRWQRAFYVDDDVYNIAVYIENQNLNIGIRDIPYEVIVLDKDNQPIGQPYINSTYVGPSEATALVITGFEAGDQVPARVLFRFLREPVWEKTDIKFSSPQLIARNRVISNVETRPRLTAVLENVTFDDFSEVPVIGVVYDADGNAMAVSQTFIDFLYDGEQAEVVFTWPLPFPRPANDLEIIPRINPFDPNRLK